MRGTEILRSPSLPQHDIERLGMINAPFVLSAHVALADHGTEDERCISGDDFADDLAVFHFEAFAAGDFEAARVEAELVQNRGVDIGDIVAVLDG